MKHSLTLLAALLLAPLAALHATEVREWRTESESEDEFRKLLQKAQTNAAAETVIHVQHAISISKTVELWWPGPGRLIVDGGKSGRLLGQRCAAGQDALAVGGPDITIRNLRISDSGGWALRIGGAGRYSVEGCEFIGSRGGGLVVWNEQAVPRPREVAARSLVRSNLVERFNQSGQQWSNDGISIADDDVDVIANTVRDCQAETMGMRIMGRGHRVEHNRVERVGHSDSGGIYLWGGVRVYECLGTEVRHNFIADVSRGIYLDDSTSGASVHGNAIFRAQVAGVFIGGGRDNRVTKNLVAHSPIGVHMDNRTVGWKDMPDKLALWASARAHLSRVLQEGGIHAQRLRERFPQLRQLQAPVGDPAYSRPENNVIRENILTAVATDFRAQDYSGSQPPDTAFAAWNQIAPSRKLEPTQVNELNFSAAGLEHLHTSTQAGSQAVLDRKIPTGQTTKPSP